MARGYSTSRSEQATPKLGYDQLISAKRDVFGPDGPTREELLVDAGSPSTAAYASRKLTDIFDDPRLSRIGGSNFKVGPVEKSRLDAQIKDISKSYAALEKAGEILVEQLRKEYPNASDAEIKEKAKAFAASTPGYLMLSPTEYSIENDISDRANFSPYTRGMSEHNDDKLDRSRKLLNTDSNPWRGMDAENRKLIVGIMDAIIDKNHGKFMAGLHRFLVNAEYHDEVGKRRLGAWGQTDYEIKGTDGERYTRRGGIDYAQTLVSSAVEHLTNQMPRAFKRDADGKLGIEKIIAEQQSRREKQDAYNDKVRGERREQTVRGEKQRKTRDYELEKRRSTPAGRAKDDEDRKNKTGPYYVEPPDPSEGGRWSLD